MEKQKSLSCKSTRFLVLFLTISFSLVLLSYLFSWAMQASPFIHQEAHFLLNPLNMPSFTAPFTDLPNNTVSNSYSSNTHVKAPHVLPGFVGNSSVEVSVSSSSRKTKDKKVNLKGFSDLSLKVANLGGTHLRKPQNSSGFVVKTSTFKGKVGKVDSYVAKGDVTRRSSVLVDKVDGEVGNKSHKFCDVSVGKWVVDEKYPLYTNSSCPFIDEGFNCQGNGRLDKDYMRWKWQPQDCDIPRFNATNMLELIRGKRLVFAGDSINRNQWESLLCLLMGAVKDPRKLYETRGRRITKNRGTYSFRFVDYQCTVEFYVSHFLVRESKAKVGKKRKGTLRIDSIDRESAKWRGADILVFNTGNWWSHYKTKAGKNYYQEGNEVYSHLDPITAYRKALETWAAWVDRYVNSSKTHVFFRSTAPAHFRGGQWNTGGHCREARNPLGEMYIENPAKDIIAQEVISTMKTQVTFLNVSGLSSYRIDAHPSKYGRNLVKTSRSVEDCSHWCLPGVPDTWNELLYHQILLKQHNSLYTS
ncbi:hypothetical protein RND81_07G010000 [Saponaria officinalis]|uniref:Trichome birefringence-like N-terminal domain-containing protein n=1 Tax=Saponaria officinalis TaxID=3572 RepID=A0AAW1JPA5_SAPOF